MKRVLACVDGSEPSLRAGRLAHELATALGAELTFVYVARPSLAPADAPWVDQLNRDELSHGAKVISEAVAALGIAALTVSSRVLLGTPAETIAELATSEGFELVVVGSTGKNAVKRILLGSVADRLIHACTVPVLVVR